MRIMLAGLLLAAGAGIYADQAAAQPPTYLYLGPPRAELPRAGANGTQDTVERGTTGWMNICRERVAVRSDIRGHAVRVVVPSCNMVWVGRRYFYNGNYYADPTFTTPIN